MEGFKLKQNYQEEIGFGLLFGWCLLIINMDHGQQVGKLILWKVEEILIIQNQLEEEFNLMVQHFIGDQTGQVINLKKLMLSIL